MGILGAWGTWKLGVAGLIPETDSQRYKSRHAPFSLGGEAGLGPKPPYPPALVSCSRLTITSSGEARAGGPHPLFRTLLAHCKGLLARLG